MDKKVSCRNQILAFKEYAGRYPDQDLLPLFNKWADNNNIYGIDRQKIWKHARNLRPRKTLVIKEGSEEWTRLHAVLDILHEADMKYLNKLLEKRGKS